MLWFFDSIKQLYVFSAKQSSYLRGYIDRTYLLSPFNEKEYLSQGSNSFLRSQKYPVSSDFSLYCHGLWDDMKHTPRENFALLFQKYAILWQYFDGWFYA